MTDDPRPLVLHVIHHLVVGGLENGLVNLVNHLPRDEFRHAIVCVEDYSDFRGRVVRDDVEVIALHRSRIGAAGVRREIYRLCRRLRPALLHARSQSGLDALLPSWLAGVPRRIHSEHGWDVDNLDGSRLKPILLRRLHSPLIDRYIVVSKHLERFLIGKIGIAPRRITQIYNGVDTARFGPADSSLRSELPPAFRDGHVVTIGSVGRIQPVKDHATLLRAVAGLVHRRPDLRARVRLALIGDGPLFAEMRELVQQLAIDDIAWLPGRSDRVAALLKALDIFALPSLNEGISNTILEAMATGLPVVATAVGGNVELVQDGITGRLVPVGAVDVLSDCLESYVCDPKARRQHGHAGRAETKRAFSLSTMIDRYRSMYAALCGMDRRAAPRTLSCEIRSTVGRVQQDDLS